MIFFYELELGKHFKRVFMNQGILEGIKTKKYQYGNKIVNCLIYDPKKDKLVTYFIPANDLIEPI